MGPGSSSWLWRAPPVMPGISLLSMTVLPFWTTVTILELLISSGPSPGVISAPFSTFHAGDVPGLSSCQPVKSFRLKRGIAADQLGGLVLLRAGAPWPVHCQGLPSGPLVVPERIFPASAPSKTRSTLLPSSSLGETNFRRPFDSSALASGRAFPQRPTISALSRPFFSRRSNQERYSWTVALIALRMRSDGQQNDCEERECDLRIFIERRIPST